MRGVSTPQNFASTTNQIFFFSWRTVIKCLPVHLCIWTYLCPGRDHTGVGLHGGKKASGSVCTCCLGGLSGVVDHPTRYFGSAAGSIREVRRQVSRSTVRIQDLVPREVGLQGKCQREGNSWGLWQQGLWSGHQRVPQIQEVSDLVTGTLLSPQSLLFEVQVIFHGAS